MNSAHDPTAQIPTQAEGLVEPEGVNANSAISTTESPQPRPRADVTRGGHAERAPAPEPEPDADLVVPPWGEPDPAGPSLEQSVEEARVRRR